MSSLADKLNMKPLRFLVRLITALVLTAVSAALSAEAVLVEEHGYSIDLPAGWEILDISDLSNVSFTDPNHAAVFQIKTYPAKQFEDARDIFDHVRSRFSAQGESEVFSYLGMDAVFSDLSFQAAGYSVRGYMTFINGFSRDYALITFVPQEYYESYHDFLLSCIDSFASGDEARYYPGPVSQYFYPFPGPNRRGYRVPFGEKTFAFAADPGSADANQVLIEREARILTAYQANYGKDELWKDAWKRYYRLIYRDNYQRLAPLAHEVDEYFYSIDAVPERIAADLLDWLQDYDYSGSGSLSDLLSPVTCLLEYKGDCDSLSLTFIILLHHMGIDAVLFISDVYSHAIAGVDVRGAGARITVGETPYLVAELTADVDLGLIERSMADPAGWIPVEFELTEF
jgi:hypothetical protein